MASSSCSSCSTRSIVLSCFFVLLLSFNASAFIFPKSGANSPSNNLRRAILSKMLANVTNGTLPGVKAILNQSSVSGLSSGAYFAVQMHVAYSSIMIGAGIFAGGPYNCAEGILDVALTTCMEALPLPPNAQHYAEQTNQRSSSGTIDNTKYLKNQRVFLFSGTLDTVVRTPVVKSLQQYYQIYIGSNSNSNVSSLSTGSIYFENSVPAEHTQPTITTVGTNPCSVSASPYISYCNYDGAGQALQYIFGNTLKPRQTTLTGILLVVNQSLYLPPGSSNPAKYSLGPNGFAYFPASCLPPASGNCRVHVTFHGCLQSYEEVGMDYVEKAGYNEWADANNIIVIYPQTIASDDPYNPKACWNWWGYGVESKTYDTQQGVQMQTIKNMINQLCSSSN